MNGARLSTPDSTPRADRPGRAAAVSPPDPRDPWLEMVAAGFIASPLAGEPGHGGTAVLRRQPCLIAGGRAERGRTDVFELICCECGDNPYLDYSQVSPRLQRVRGPYPIAAALTTYEQHLGLTVPDSPA